MVKASSSGSYLEGRAIPPALPACPVVERPLTVCWVFLAFVNPALGKKNIKLKYTWTFTFYFLVLLLAGLLSNVV